MAHVTTDKGDLGVAMITADLIEKGISVFNPISATSPFDLLIYHNGNYKRVQVKYRAIKANGAIHVDLKRSTISNGKVTSVVRNNEVDIVAIYCPNNRTCYYINALEIIKTISIRILKSKNNQVSKIKSGEDYLNLFDVKVTGSNPVGATTVGMPLQL